MAAAPFIVMAASAAYKHEQEKAMADAQKQMQKNTNKMLVAQTDANYSELSDVEREEQAKTLDDSLSIQKEYIKNKGNVNVMAAAMGTGGMSMKSQLNDLSREKFSDYNTILEDRQARMDNLKSQATNMRYDSASRQDVRPISRPSNAALALNLTGAAVGGYTAQQSSNQNADLLKTVRTGR